MKISCNIIQDLIPLYYDNVCSIDSTKMVKKHLDECSHCQKYYHTLCETNTLEDVLCDTDYELKSAKSFKDFSKKMVNKTLLTAYTIAMLFFIVFMLIVMYIGYDLAYNKEDYSNIKDYQASYDTVFTNSMRDIWPQNIQPNNKDIEYKFITYYDDVTAYTGYLKIKYNQDDYIKEVERLKNLTLYQYNTVENSIDFSQYTVLAIDTYNLPGHSGFTYALSKDNTEIIYIELEYPHEKPRNDYKKIIPTEYLPANLKFEEDNQVSKQQLLIWYIIPSMVSIVFLILGFRNVNRKRILGYLQIFFSTLLILFVLANIISIIALNL